MNPAAEAGAEPVPLIIRWDVLGRNPFVLRLASNYSSAQGSVLFQLIGVGSESALPNGQIYRVAKSFTRFDAAFRTLVCAAIGRLLAI